MALILAIESDKRQVNYLTAMVKGKLHAELVLGDTAEGALNRLGDRVPDLILTSALLSPKDEQALGDRLRRLNGVAAHVQMLTLPVLGPPSKGHASNAKGGMLSALLGDRGSQTSAPDGCDPAVFADQCREYLRRAAEERDARRHENVAPIAAAEVLPETGETEAAFTWRADAASPTVEVEAPQTDEADATSQVEEPETATVDIDLSNLLGDDDLTPRAAAAEVEEDEPAVYDLSAESLDLSFSASPVEAPRAPAAEPALDDFDDWQKVVDALKRESAGVRIPRTAEPRTPQTVPASAAAPEPAATSATQPPAIAAKIATAEPPKRRLRPTADEWGMFDPAQAGMAALYERLEKITRDEERR